MSIFPRWLKGWGIFPEWLGRREERRIPETFTRLSFRGIGPKLEYLRVTPAREWVVRPAAFDFVNVTAGSWVVTITPPMGILPVPEVYAIDAIGQPGFVGKSAGPGAAAAITVRTVITRSVAAVVVSGRALVRALKPPR